MKQYHGWRLRLHYCIVGALDVASGLTTLLTLGYVNPMWSMKYLLWNFDREILKP